MEARAITREEISDVARRLSVFLDRKEIKSFKDLEKKVDQSSPVLIRPRHIITMEIRPSDFGSLDYIISYIILKKGIPIEVSVNPNMNYYRIILRTESRLNGYDLFARDEFGNVNQIRTVFDGSIPELKRELEVLSGD